MFPEMEQMTTSIVKESWFDSKHRRMAVIMIESSEIERFFACNYSGSVIELLLSRKVSSSCSEVRIIAHAITRAPEWRTIMAKASERFRRSGVCVSSV